MKNTPILETIEPEIVETLVTRRDAIAKGAGMSSTLVAGLALGSIPVALAALSRNAWAQNAPAAVLDVLEFAYLLENLEAEFYKAVLSAAAFAPVRATLIAGDVTAFTTIRDHEIAHVEFLRSALVANGRTPATYTAASFDFTGGNGSGTPGPFAAATTTRAVLLGAAQAFEDTGVRAYKGQAGNLFAAPTVLQQALTIHSVEARHAAKIRKMRATTAGASVKASGTITRNQSGITLGNAGDAVIAKIYAGEENTNHIVFNGAAATLDANTYAGTAFGGTDAATEAFDEPLTKEQVTEIVNPFIVGGPA